MLQGGYVLKWIQEYGQQLRSESLHKLGANIRKRLHGQLVVTESEETDGVTFDIYNRPSVQRPSQTNNTPEHNTTEHNSRRCSLGYTIEIIFIASKLVPR